MQRTAPILLLLAACGSGPSSGDSSGAALDSYAAGDFEKAEQAIRKGPKDLLALRLLGRIQIIRNQLPQAIETLRQALALSPNDPVAVQDLAAAYYRQDDFASASLLYKALGEEVLHAKYAALARQVSYAARWEEEPSVISWVSADPVPTIRLRVNGIKGLFVLDTGTGEIVLDDSFAKKVRAKGVGVRVENFAGPLEEGYVEEVSAGSVAVHNVPVRIRKLQPIGRQEIDGLLGINFFLHFSVTLDYRKHRLILRRAGGLSSPTGTEVPFFIAGDRFLILPGKIDGGSTFFFLHTGMPKVPVAPSQGVVWTLSQGESAGYRVESIQFGPVTLSKPAFDARAFPTGLDTNFGFTIGAAVGHEAFRDRIVTIEPERMRLTIE